jgi:hypothetical protein
LGQPVLRPAIAGSFRFAHEEHAAQSQKSCGTFRRYRRGAERASDDHIEGLAQRRIAGEELGSSHDRFDPAADRQVTDRVPEEGNPTFLSVDQRKCQVGPIEPDHQTRNAPARSEIENACVGRNAGYETAGVLDVGAHCPGTEEPEVTAPLQLSLELLVAHPNESTRCISRHSSRR